MTDRLTPEALDALLVEHHSMNDELPPSKQRKKPYCMGDHWGYDEWADSPMPWPCTVYLLASEVRDAREAIVEYVEAGEMLGYCRRHPEKADYREALDYAGVRHITAHNRIRALAHYEEGKP